MDEPAYLHLEHREAWLARANYVAAVALAVDPTLSEYQIRGLRAYCRDAWIRLGGCWCITAPRSEVWKMGPDGSWDLPLAAAPVPRRVPYSGLQRPGGNSVSEFRSLLHDWARKQLREQSGHTGTFEIESVYLDQVHGYSMGNDYIEVNVSFTHTGCTLHAYDGLPCRVKGHWSMPDTTTTVKILNELLAS